ncbi:MAG: hypothetical protein HKN19_06310 [Halioglobus sp.]|nr:hypothetical protein [Halioglobus sp.]
MSTKQEQHKQPTRVRKTVNDLVMAEMFLLQATLESAAAISDGIAALGSQWHGEEEQPGGMAGVLARTADEVVEPYTTRYRYFRDMIARDSGAARRLGGPSA